MSAKHRKASKLAAKRTAIAATAIGATASIGMMGAPAHAAAPDYSQAISDYSHALDYFLNASNNVNGSVGSVWNPIAGQTGGVLPTLTSSFTKVDVTKISNLSTVLRSIADLNLPTGVPGIVPNIVLPGGQTIALPLPTAMPGADLLNDAADTLDGITSLPLIGSAIDQLPPLSQIIVGLEATQSDYASGYVWPLLGLKGQTNFLNTFVQTPSGLTIGEVTVPILGTIGPIPVLPEDSLPSGTVWVPQGDGSYEFPLGAEIGWWAAAPTAALKIPGWLGGSETVLSVPIGAAGVQLPLGLASAGTLGANVLLPTANGVYSPLSLTMSNLNTAFGFGVTNLNITTGNYVGTNGFNLNNGQNLVVLQNPLGIPLPLIYGLGGLSFGTEGAGLSSPSLFGIKLFTDIVIGDTVGPNSPAGLIPEALLPTDPMGSIISTVTGGLGVGSLTQILGIDTLILDPLTGLLTPAYKGFSDIALKPISDFATQQYGPFVNGSASSLLDFSKTLSEQTANLPGAPEQPELLTTTNDASDAEPANESILPFSSPVQKQTTEGGDHRLGKPGGTPVSEILARDDDPEPTEPVVQPSTPPVSPETNDDDTDEQVTEPPTNPIKDIVSDIVNGEPEETPSGDTGSVDSTTTVTEPETDTQTDTETDTSPDDEKVTEDKVA